MNLSERHEGIEKETEREEMRLLQNHIAWKPFTSYQIVVMEKETQAIVSSSSQRKRRNKTLVNIASPSSLPDNVVEEIFLKLPVKSLMRLKSLSKQWRSTIESHFFSHMHLKISQRSHVDHAKVMIITWNPDIKNISFRTISLESVRFLPSNLFNFPHVFRFHDGIYASESCDGLFCVHSPNTQEIYVVNPATRWFRQLPPARFQILMDKLNPTLGTFGDLQVQSISHLAFVKASDYKLVWLYNSDVYNSDASSPDERVTKCEVFDFKANTWRYLTCTPSYRIYHDQKPVSVNGSLYWFTEPYNTEIKVIALDIRTEIFRLLPKPSLITSSDPSYIDMCILGNSLCMYETEGNKSIQEIWKLKSSEDVWEKIYTINLLSSYYSHFDFLDGFSSTDGFNWPQKDLVKSSIPVAIYKNKKILLSHPYTRNLH
ncbi:PREDICTED: putative F-box/kelch-repeat protein At1g12870 [Camelina sativa]|uniref:F-box/kelch-repeat protein At1g12870 n=1 Tax=Camelina sativa TaxID=90675 RepID=A0ABM0X4D9_CAMSA|nr:PREDICTED: putative F-box/kelch-repeat protein At1g12870 [Camelina sativa]